MSKVKAKLTHDCAIRDFSGLPCTVIDCKELDADREEYEYCVEVEKEGKKWRGVVREYDLIFD